jgi:hypothetical protein
MIVVTQRQHCTNQQNVSAEHNALGKAAAVLTSSSTGKNSSTAEDGLATMTAAR